MTPQRPSTTPRRKKYGRNSSDEQHKMATITSQQAAVDEWDRAHGGDPQPGDWYVDEGWSGFTLDRPDLDRLRDAARDPARDWHEIVIYDTSRLSREPGHRLYILEPEFKELGLTIHYVASPVYDDTADGRAMAGVQGVFDKWFADKAKETMRRGLRDAVRNGVCWWAPYGYVVQRTLDPHTGRALFVVTIEPGQAAVVRAVYAAVLAGQSTVQITRDLNARGVPTARGGRWWPSTIRDMIYDPYYVGEAGYGTTTRVLPRRRRDATITHRRRPKTTHAPRERAEWMGTATVPAIIEPAIQQRAIEALTSNQRRQERAATAIKHPYLLRGLLRCPCGFGLAGHAPRRKDGSVRPFYRCSRRNLDPQPGEPLTCPTQLQGPATDALVWDAVIGALGRSGDIRAALEQLQSAPAQRRREWEEAIVRCSAERDRLRLRLRTQQRLLEEGTYSAQDYAIARADVLPALEAAERDLEHATRERAAVRVPAIDGVRLEQLCALISAKAAKATPQERAEVLGALLVRIDVHPDHLDIQGALGDLSVPREGLSRYQLETDGAGRRTNRGCAPAP